MSGDKCSLHQITASTDLPPLLSTLSPTGLAVLYFQTPWAEPCKQMTTVLETLASTYDSTSPPNILFTSIEAEQCADTSEEYSIESVPHVVLVRQGKVVESIGGKDAARVRAAVEKHAGGTNPKIQLPPAQIVKPAPPAPQPASTASNTDPSAAESASSKEALDARLGELVKAAPVMLFMKGTPSAPQCGFSRQTVALLREKSIRYGFFNILADDDVRQGLKTYSDWPTFPQVYVDGELIGGLDIVSLFPILVLK